MELLHQQNQKQKQNQKISQRQIQAISILSMDSFDLREKILKEVNENPALEVVSDPLSSDDFSSTNTNNKSSDVFQATLESKEDDRETLQQHLMNQIRLSKLSQDEMELCQKLIYNLDKNGFYGSKLSPQTFLDKTRPVQNQKMLDNCMNLIQHLDPIGTCCKNTEESLLIQAKIKGNASPLVLFILDGHLDFLSPPIPEKIAKNIISYKNNWHSKQFSSELPIDSIKIDEKSAKDALDFILQLNPYPAENYVSDTSQMDENIPDVILKVSKEKGFILSDEFENGKIYGGKDFYFQVKYASGILPEIRISKDFSFDKQYLERAKIFVENIKFRENTIALQGCAIVSAQKDFFDKGPEFLKPLLRKQIAQELGIHESTVSRLSSRKNSKYLQCDWGILPISYFFGSGLNTANGENKISSQVIKAKIVELTESDQNISDNELTKLLNEMGIKIARRTVSKYRQQAGIKNSYLR